MASLRPALKTYKKVLLTNFKLDYLKAFFMLDVNSSGLSISFPWWVALWAAEKEAAAFDAVCPFLRTRQHFIKVSRWNGAYGLIASILMSFAVGAIGTMVGGSTTLSRLLGNCSLIMIDQAGNQIHLRKYIIDNLMMYHKQMKISSKRGLKMNKCLIFITRRPKCISNCLKYINDYVHIALKCTKNKQKIEKRQKCWGVHSK